MKRVICVLLLLALTVPVLLLPASAAEEYVFEWVNPEAMMLDDSYLFNGFSGSFFVCQSLVPYDFYAVFSESVLGFSFIDYRHVHSLEQFGLDYDGVVFSVPFLDDDGSELGLSLDFVMCYVEENGDFFTVIGCASTQSIDFSGMSLTLTPVPPMDLIAMQFSDFTSVVNHIFTIIVETPLLAVFTAAGLVLVCIPLYIRARKSVH